MRRLVGSVTGGDDSNVPQPPNLTDQCVFVTV